MFVPNKFENNYTITDSLFFLICRTIRFCNMFISHESAHYYILSQNTQMLLQAVVLPRSYSKFPQSPFLIVDAAILSLLSSASFFRT